MTARSKLGLIAVLGVIVVGALLVLRQNPNQNVPLTATAPAPATVTSATLQSIPTATSAPAITSSMITDEQRVMDMVLSSSPQFTTSSDDCFRILHSEPWCSVVQGVQQITRPEWKALFPQAKFFLVKRNVVGQESGFQQDLLIAELAGQQYNADSFQHLLDANSVVITDTNRELVARALVSMKLADYLQEDIAFSDWGPTEQPSRVGMSYNYKLTAWTKIQGLKFEWFFLFYEGSLITAEGAIPEKHIGDYIDVPFDVLHFPSSFEALNYWKQ